MAGERLAELGNGRVDECGKYLHPVRRGAAQEKAKLRARGVTVTVYECPVPGNDGWHVGHQAQDVRNGTVPADAARQHRDHTRVFAHAPFVGAPVTVTWNDPRAAARACDALEAAAVALEQCAPKASRQYRRDAERLADALQRAAVPPVNA